MSHQSGIRTSQELADLFVTAVAGGNLRVIRVSIVSESLIPDGTAEVSGSWETDFSKIQDFLEEKKPAYIIYRLDTKSSAGDYEWLFLAYVPDNAKVRDKMLYASTRATLTKELGDYRFVDSMYGSTTEEFTLEGYRKHLQHQKADAPLTEREKELNEVRAAEASTNVYSSSARRSHAAGVSFPTANDAIQALKNLGQTDRSENLVQLKIDMEGESIELASATQIDVGQLSESIPTDVPRFSFFAYKHNYNGEEHDSIVFIYTCPSNSKIRERMLYSSSKASVISTGQSECGLTIAKKLETHEVGDLTEAYLLEELHPKREPLSRGFDRPKPPGRRTHRT